MNQISSSEALSIFGKWRDEASILELGFNDAETGAFKRLPLLIHKVIEDGKPTLILSILIEPFPFASIVLDAAEFECGDSRSFDDAPLPVLDEIRRKLVQCVLIKHPSGKVFLFSELKRGDDTGLIQTGITTRGIANGPRPRCRRSTSVLRANRSLRQ